MEYQALETGTGLWKLAIRLADWSAGDEWTGTRHDGVRQDSMGWDMIG